MRTGRGQRVAAAWAVRGQPYPAVGAELPMRCDLAAAIAALLDKMMRLLLDSRVVDVPMAYNPTCVIFSSLKPLFFNNLKNESCFSDHVGA
jgi:hypothetical protein